MNGGAIWILHIGHMFLNKSFDIFYLDMYKQLIIVLPVLSKENLS